MKKSIEQYITEGRPTGLEKTVAARLKKAGVVIRDVDKKQRIVFKLAKGIDENDMANFSLIDAIFKLLEKTYPGAIVKHDFDKFIVEEL
jgi:hypothetical protein